MSGALAARVATVADAAVVGALLHDFNTEFATTTPGPDVLTARLVRLLAAGTTFAVLSGTPAVGFALVTLRTNVWYEGPVATVDELYVVPGLRGQGIGAAVMEVVETEARARGVEAIEINVDAPDVDAQRFYERLGYSGTEPDTGERAFYFFRDL